MNHRPITEDDLHAYVDRALEPERRAEVAAYLEDHPEGARRIGAFADQRDLLRAALAPIVEEPLPPELNLSRIIGQRARRPSLAGWAVAAMLLLGVGGIGGWAMRGAMQASPEGLAALAREAAASYSVYAPDRIRPVELRASDAAELVTWISARLHRAVKVPDLTNSGYRLMGGRVVATEHGPAAMFMYDDDHGGRIVLLARPMISEDQNAPMTPQSLGDVGGLDVGGLAWADDGLGYGLVGEAVPEALRPVANEVRRQAREIS
jgi:anti-sigma factor RsiW